jgi:hypothetical protein
MKMLKMIESWSKSKMRQKDFCKQHQLGYHVFHYWLKVWKKGQVSNKSSSFIPVKLTTQDFASEPKTAEIVFPDGRRIIFYNNPDPALLRNLLF